MVLEKEEPPVNNELFSPAFAILVAAVTYVLFAVVTKWSLEDAMIVGRIARNFSTRGALSYNSGSLVSSATSPVFALTVGLLAKLHLDPLIAAQMLGMIATLVTGLVIYRASGEYLRGNQATFPMLIFLLLPNTVAYSICGLETPVYTLACALSLLLGVSGASRTSIVSAGIATILRPDGLITLIFSLLIAVSLKRPRHEILAGVSIAVLLILLSYGIHRLTYGALLPLSVTAKSQVYAVDPVRNLARYAHRMFLTHPISLPLYALAIVGIHRAAKTNRAVLWLVAWYVVYHAAFVARAPLFSWYLQPPVFVMAFFSGVGFAAIADRASTIQSMPPFIKKRLNEIAIVSIVVASAVSVVIYSKGRSMQANYEHEVRAAAGKWLKANTTGSELVFTESLGFVGYTAPNPFIDWPGLVTPDAPDLVKGLPRLEGYRIIIDKWMPVFLVLRDDEWEGLRSQLQGYSVVARFAHESAAGPAYVIAKKE